MQDGLRSGEQRITSFNLTTSSASTGAVAPFVYISTLTGAGSTGGRALFQLNLNAAIGSFANALKGITIIGTSGSATGLASGIVAELKLPGAGLAGIGSYAVLEMELVTQSSGTTGGAPVAFQWMQVSGDTTATNDFDDTGYLFIIKGLTDAAGNIFDLDTGLTKKGSLRILIGSTPYYIMLASSPTA